MPYISKKEKRKKQILILSLSFLIILSIFTIKQTYAKYITQTSSDANMSIARWKILVNNKDITNEKELTNIISPIFKGNDNIAANVIAPTAEGYFDMIIDASNTDVSLKYEITTSNNDNSIVKDMSISGYSLNDGEKQEIISKDNQIKIEDQIPYNSKNKELKIRVYLKWNDDENNGATMDNKADTNTTTIKDGLAKVNVHLKFIQLPTVQNTN